MIPIYIYLKIYYTNINNTERLISDDFFTIKKLETPVLAKPILGDIPNTLIMVNTDPSSSLNDGYEIQLFGSSEEITFKLTKDNYNDIIKGNIVNLRKTLNREDTPYIPGRSKLIELIIQQKKN
jgi:hypothetical protein